MNQQEFYSMLNRFGNYLVGGGIMSIILIYREWKRAKAENRAMFATTEKTNADRSKVDVDIRAEYQALYESQIKFITAQRDDYQTRYGEVVKKNEELMKLILTKDHDCEKKINELERKVEDLQNQLNEFNLRFPKD